MPTDHGIIIQHILAAAYINHGMVHGNHPAGHGRIVKLSLGRTAVLGNNCRNINDTGIDSLYTGKISSVLPVSCLGILQVVIQKERKGSHTCGQVSLFIRAVSFRCQQVIDLT